MESGLRWSRRASWLLVFGLLLALTVPGRAAAKRPNVLFILVDDLRWDALSCTGHPVSRTPNIDRIAKEGATFRNAFVTTPLCSPSRASFLTGQYVHTHGIWGNGAVNNTPSHKLVTFPALLQGAKYETAYIGKWHMGNDDTPRRGFNHWVSFKGQGAHVDPELNVDGQVSKVSGYMTDILTEHALEFIRKPRTQPFAMVLAHKAVHGPFVPAPRHRELYTTEPIQRTPGTQDTLEGKPVLQREVGTLPKIGPGTGAGEPLIRNQLRMLAAIDEGIGKIFETLYATGKLDDTIVVFTSDNGYFWGEHGLGDKRAAYEESIRIPLLVRYPPKVKAGLQLEQIALNVDIAPTLLDLCDVNRPGFIQGKSLVERFEHPNSDGRDAALFEYTSEPAFPRIPTWQAVRTRRWKFIHYPNFEGMDELYDLEEDRYELRNVIQDRENRRVVRNMQDKLRDLLQDTGVKKPGPVVMPGGTPNPG